MKIWIDADACPRAVKEILFRASARLRVPLCLVANKSLAKHAGPLVECVTVTGGFDVADDYIAEHAAPTDLLSELRDTGLIERGGPAPFGMSDRNRFASALDSLPHRRLRR